MNPRRMTLVALLLLVACQAPDPEGSFHALEARLASAQVVSMDFQVRAEGAVEVNLSGALRLGDDDSVTLEATGSFAGQPVDVALTAAGGALALGNRPHLLSADLPQHLDEAILVGFTRMGILHNLARLVSGAAPDHAEGGVGEWVAVGGFRPGEGPSGTIEFDLTVAGEPSGSASLVLDGDGHPLERRQTVHFPTGEMRVVETYSAVTIEP